MKPSRTASISSPKSSARFTGRDSRQGIASDPFSAATDPAMPAIAAALNFDYASHAFRRHLPWFSGDAQLRLNAIRVTHHNPGCDVVVEYDVTLLRQGQPDEDVTLIGKSRVGQFGTESCRIQDQFWKAGFDSGGRDGISVPEPVGAIADLQMWFQRKIAGVTARDVFAMVDHGHSVAVARRVAGAIHKLHTAGITPEKQHTMADELDILRRDFNELAAARPAWTGRLAKLLVACDRVGTQVPAAKLCGVLRDFNPARVIVDGERLWLTDLDLYRLGDPGMDAGNFVAHITEQALRERGDANALIDLERALENRFVELAGEEVRASVRAYATLALARQICISAQFPDRSRVTERLLNLCEERVSQPPQPVKSSIWKTATLTNR